MGISRRDLEIIKDALDCKLRDERRRSNVYKILLAKQAVVSVLKQYPDWEEFEIEPAGL